MRLLPLKQVMERGETKMLIIPHHTLLMQKEDPTNRDSCRVVGGTRVSTNSPPTPSPLDYSLGDFVARHSGEHKARTSNSVNKCRK